METEVSFVSRGSCLQYKTSQWPVDLPYRVFPGDPHRAALYDVEGIGIVILRQTKIYIIAVITLYAYSSSTPSPHPKVTGI